MSGNPQLRAFLEGRIARSGRIPFSEYMDAVLYHPEHGYYTSRRNPIGPVGDFYTAPMLDPALGQLLSRLFVRMAEGLAGFTLVELGAGTGRLARHILESSAFPYLIVERSPSMRQRQQRLLEGFDVAWVDALPSGLDGCVFSNEFFDALPVRRFVRRKGAVRELFVGPGLGEEEGDPNPPVDLPLLVEGATADIAPGAVEWVRRIGASLRRGYHLAIDYGYLREAFFSRRNGTLMCYRKHQADEDPYDSPGEKDLTAHVNFSDLVDAGREAGLDLADFRSQKDFLVDLGLLEIMEPLARESTAASLRRLQSLKTLILPPMMGERFRVLLQCKGLEVGPLPGFPGANRS
jgi:SAM-dependent MidA family methyltransferase